MSTLITDHSIISLARISLARISLAGNRSVNSPEVKSVSRINKLYFPVSTALTSMFG